VRHCELPVETEATTLRPHQACTITRQRCSSVPGTTSSGGGTAPCHALRHRVRVIVDRVVGDGHDAVPCDSEAELTHVYDSAAIRSRSRSSGRRAGDDSTPCDEVPQPLYKALHTPTNRRRVTTSSGLQ
jgi:hypothetical protein